MDTCVANIPTVLNTQTAELDISEFIPEYTLEIEDAAEFRSSQIRILGSEHARQVAELHIEGINTGFISSLGVNFVTALYDAIAQSEHAFGYIYASPIDENKVLGFVAFTNDVGALYRSILKKKGLRFAFILARHTLSFSRIKRIFETLLYPKKANNIELPSAELLSISVASEARKKGLGYELINKGLKTCYDMGIEKVKVMVAEANAPANMLYQKCGFKLTQQTDSHGVPSNIYVSNTLKDKTDIRKTAESSTTIFFGNEKTKCMQAVRDHKYKKTA
jgi:ribosomal protein S18 acetylase RimI-like enzyme